MEPGHHPGEEYTGPAQVLDEETGQPLAVQVDLRGRFEPIDGRFSWYGRIAADGTLAERYRSGTTLVLTTPYGSASGRISDLDPWGRFRIKGSGTPPF